MAEYLGEVRAERGEKANREYAARLAVGRDGRHLMVPKPWQDPRIAAPFAIVMWVGWGVWDQFGDRLPDLGSTFQVYWVIGAVAAAFWFLWNGVQELERREQAIKVAQGLLRAADGDVAVLRIIPHANSIDELDAVRARLEWDNARNSDGGGLPAK